MTPAPCNLSREDQTNNNTDENKDSVGVGERDVTGGPGSSERTAESVKNPVWYERRKVNEKSLEDQAGFLSNWFVSYVWPLLRLGASKTLVQSDIGACSAEDKADVVYRKFKVEWESQVARVEAYNKKHGLNKDIDECNMDTKEKTKSTKKKRKQPNVASALAAAFGRRRIYLALVCYFVASLLQFAPVLVLKELVIYFESIEVEMRGGGERYVPIIHPWWQVVALAVCPLISSSLTTRSQVIFQHVAVFVRTAISSALFRKSLRISPTGRTAANTGQVVNMMSNDTTQIQRFLQFVGMSLTAPMQILLSLVLIYREVGAATWVGVFFMVVLFPFNGIAFSIVAKMRRRVLKYSDLRVKMMNELLTGIRIIKYYAWEKPFAREVAVLREEELKALTKLAYTAAIAFSLILLSAPIIQPIIVFLTYIEIQSVPLSASTAFTTVALFNLMRFPFAFLPMGILQFIQSMISVRRIGRYLMLPELVDYVDRSIDEKSDKMQDMVGYISLENATFSWVDPNVKVNPIEPKKSKKKNRKEKKGKKHEDVNGNDTNSISSTASSSTSVTSSVSGTGSGEASSALVPALRNVTLRVEPGSLVAVVGAVGSGKSSLLSALLGEMEPVGDSIVSSVVRMPGGSGNRLSYCAQTPWIVSDTLRGNILFGRPYDEDRYRAIIKACALESDLDILPAGDATEIGERGINLSGGQKARVSLARALYDPVVKVVLMDDPLSAVDAHVSEHLFQQAIASDGAAAELHGGATRILVTHHVHFLPRCDVVVVMEEGRIAHTGTYDELVEKGVEFPGAESQFGDEDNKVGEVEASGASSEKIEKETSSDVAASPDKMVKKSKPKSLITEEERGVGNVAGKAYLHFARSGGCFIFFGMFVIQGIGRASEILSSFWLSHWAEAATSAFASGENLTNKETKWYMNIYAAFGMGGILCLTIRSLIMAVHRLRASRKLHNDLVNSIFRAPVAFFDVTPTGRVLNRFSADMDKIDQDLNQSLGQGMGTFFSVMGAVGAMMVATKGTFLVALIPLGILYYIIQLLFKRTSTSLQRFTSIAASPIFSDFSAVLSGTTSIRAFGAQDKFLDNCEKSFNSFNACYSLVNMCNHWLGLRLDFLGGLIGAFIGSIAVATADTNFIPAGWLGLALSYSIETTGYLKFGVRMIATIEADMTSVERVLYYSREVEPEAPDILPGVDPVSEWPFNGRIVLQGCSMRYRDGPLVLKELNLTIEGGEKVGVVGRTGSGKSSIVNMLFRIVEPEKDGGVITIDGVNTSMVGTDILRKGLSIIPQDPVIFSTTIRLNIDPFKSATDEEIWDVLKEVRLASVVEALPEGLDYAVSEGGENFSQGQRQLLCIARSLLRKPKVLVMDEATASIDNATDADIQRMVRTKFADATVITIAHRINTIMDSDKILAMDDGRVAEFDTPSNLMAKPDGIFRGLVEESGKRSGGSRPGSAVNLASMDS